MSEHNSETSSNANGDSIVDVEDRKDKSAEDEDSERVEREANNTEEDCSAAPIDRGWAWVVLGACVFETIVYGGIMRSFGVFFLQYQLRFNSSASETAIMSLIQNLVLSTTALFVMTIGLQKFSSRVAVFIGSTLTVAAYLITAFTSDIRVFYFAQGVLGGAGLAFIHPPMLAIVGVYFNKHRGLANSIFSSGMSIGGLVFAPVVVKLFDEYQYTGTLLIVSGLLMNNWVAALLMRPIESYTKKKVKLIDDATATTKEDQLLLKDINHHNDETKQLTFNEIKVESDVFKTGSYSNVTKRPVDFTRMQSHDPQSMHTMSQGSPLLQRVRAHSFGIRRQRTISEDNNKYDSEINIHHSKSVLKGVVEAISRSQVAIYTSGEGICGSFFDVNIPYSKQLSKDSGDINDAKSKHEEDVPQGCYSSVKSCIFSVLYTVFDLNLLRNPVFITFLLMGFSMVSGAALLPVFIPTHAKDIGISNEKIGLLISLLAVTDLVSKISMGVVADRKWIERSTILVIVTAVLGTTAHLVRFINSFSTMIVLVVITGLCCGQYLSMYAVLLMEVIGPEKFKSSLGFGTLVHGTSIAVVFPVAGLLRDKTGSYVASFHLLGGLMYLAGFLAIIIPKVNKRQKKREAEKIKDHDDET